MRRCCRRDDFSRAEADSPLECLQGKQLDAIFCCVGGGGLLAGVLAYVKQVRPDVLCYGVEARDAAAMTASCFEGEIVELDHVRKKSETRKHSSAILCLGNLSDEHSHQSQLRCGELWLTSLLCG